MKKNSIAAMVLAFLVPGAGHFYLGRKQRAIVELIETTDDRLGILRPQHLRHQGNRRRHHFITAPQLVPCKSCGDMKKSHHVCPSCGYYAGRQVLEIEAKRPAEYIVLNIYDDDHFRNLDAWRAIRWGAGGSGSGGRAWRSSR